MSKRPNVKQHSTGLVPSFSVPLYLHRAVIFLIFKMCQKHCKFPKLYVWGYFSPVTFRGISECSYNKRVSVQSHQFIPHGNQEPGLQRTHDFCLVAQGSHALCARWVGLLQTLTYILWPQYNPMGRDYHYSHFTDLGTEAHRC